MSFLRVYEESDYAADDHNHTDSSVVCGHQFVAQFQKENYDPCAAHCDGGYVMYRLDTFSRISDTSILSGYRVAVFWY